MSEVQYDTRAVLVNGKRTLLISGAIHYARSTPAQWPDLMRRSQQAGLNMIETYVFWGLHERRRGVFDFSGRLDLFHFCRLAQEHGLAVFLRLGPYVCAEMNYGGFPAWLRDVEGIRMRTDNPPFLCEMERWLRLLCTYLKPLFAPNGGPIILAQIENEYASIAHTYGEEGHRYLEKVTHLSQALEIGIPWIMCEGGVPGMIETMNGYDAYMRVDTLATRLPHQPVLWTENWTGWHGTWGYPEYRRVPEEMAYATARFFANGGTGVNYYMWHSGTNFDREAMYLQTTHYGWNSPLNEYGLPTTAYHHLGRLHHVLHEHADALLLQDRAIPYQLGPQQVAYTYGQGTQSLTFLCNDHQYDEAMISFEKETYQLPARSITLLGGGQILMNTAAIQEMSRVHDIVQASTTQLSPFLWYSEPLTQKETRSQSKILVDQPHEQLAFTHDETDYCWYTITIDISVAQSGAGTLILRGVSDVIHVFIDEVLTATTHMPLLEDRGPLEGSGFIQTFHITLTPGHHELSLLCCALGLIKGDWMIGFQNMAEERKGFWGTALWNKTALAGSWQIQPGLVGERQRWFAEGGELLSWKRSPARKGHPLCWWQTHFTLPEGTSPLVIDLQGMSKGLLWLNTHCIGRYWLTAGIGEHSHPWLDPAFVQRVHSAEPSQRYYYLPAEWLAPSNTLILFDELGGSPETVRLCQRNSFHGVEAF